VKVAVVKNAYGTWFIVFVAHEAWPRFKGVVRRTEKMYGGIKRRTLEKYGNVLYWHDVCPRRPAVEPPLFFESVEEFESFVLESAAKLFKTSKAIENVAARLREAVKEAAKEGEKSPESYRRKRYKAFKYFCLHSWGKLPPTSRRILKKGEVVASSEYVTILEYSSSILIYRSDRHEFAWLKKEADIAEAIKEMAELEGEQLRNAIGLLQEARQLLEGEGELAERIATLASAAMLLLS